MRVLVATKHTQGVRETDSMKCIEGEVVFTVPLCAAGACSPFAVCCCAASFQSVVSTRMTTTAVVREDPVLTFTALIDALDGLRRRRLVHGPTARFDPRELAEEMVTIAEGLPIGAVVERRGVSVRARGPRRGVTLFGLLTRADDGLTTRCTDVQESSDVPDHTE